MGNTPVIVAPRKARPQDGDVLVSRLTARVEHQVVIVPAQTLRLCPNEALAVADGLQLARERRVDAWLTQDHRHFLKLVANRAGEGLEARGESTRPEGERSEATEHTNHQPATTAGHGAREAARGYVNRQPARYSRDRN